MNYKELFEKEYESLRFADYEIDEKNDTNLMSFIAGYLYAKESDELKDCIRLYLQQYHYINNQYNTWREQIDHYAYNHNLIWDNGFFRLIHEMIEKDLILEPEEQIKAIKVNWESANNYFRETAQLNNGLSIQVGDIIQLEDKIGEDYKQTKFYDSSIRNPSWHLFYPSEKDFKYVHFYFKESSQNKAFTFQRVRRLFSGTTAEVISITIQNEILIVYTKTFKIEIESALNENEVRIIKNEEEKPILTNLSILVESMKEYALGESHAPMNEIIDHFSFFNLASLNKHWHRFDKDINGRWYQVKKLGRML